MLEQSVPEGQQPIERTHTRAVCEGHGRDTQHQDEGLEERSSYGLVTIISLHSPASLRKE